MEEHMVIIELHLTKTRSREPASYIGNALECDVGMFEMGIRSIDSLDKRRVHVYGELSCCSIHRCASHNTRDCPGAWDLAGHRY